VRYALSPYIKQIRFVFKGLIGTTEHMTLYARCRLKRCRYNRVGLHMKTRLGVSVCFIRTEGKRAKRWTEQFNRCSPGMQTCLKLVAKMNSSCFLLVRGKHYRKTKEIL
jgi:hypothetical protein